MKIPPGFRTPLLILGTTVIASLALAVVIPYGVERGIEAAQEKPAAATTTVPPTTSPGAELAAIAGVVFAADRPADGATLTLGTLEPPIAPAPAVTRSIIANAFGRFSFDDLRPATYTVVVSKIDFGTQTVVVDLEPGEREDLRIRLVDGDGRIAGHVTDGTAALGGVVVTAVSGQTKVAGLSQSGGSDPGAYDLSRLPTPGAYVVSFSKKGFGSEALVINLEPGQQDLGRTVALRQGQGSISGMVTDDKGRGLGNASVAVSRAGTLVATVKTLADGSAGFYTVPGLATPGLYVVVFTADGFGTETRAVTLIEGGNATDVNPRLGPITGGMTGLVTEVIDGVADCGPGGCRLDGVEVRLTDIQGNEVKATTSATSPPDQFGRYRLVGLRADEYTATFSKPGYLPQTFRIVLAVDEQRVLDVVMQGAPGAVSGLATNCARVEALRQDGSLPPAAQNTVSSVGRYRLPLNTRGAYVLAFVRTDGTVSESIDVTLGPGEQVTDIDGSCGPVPPTDTTVPVTTTLPTDTTLPPDRTRRPDMFPPDFFPPDFFPPITFPEDPFGSDRDGARSSAPSR